MHSALHLLALVLVAVTMGLALAHALEFPGKLRLDEENDMEFHRGRLIDHIPHVSVTISVEEPAS